MRIHLRNFFFLFLILAVASCKTEFEKIRTSNDPERIFAQANTFYEAKDYQKSQTLYELVIPYYRGKTEAEELFYRFSYTHYYLKQYILASHYFKSFTTTYYNSDYREEALFMSAYSTYQLSPNSKLDQTYSLEAIESFQTFVNTYPNSDRVETCNELIDKMRLKMEEKAYQQGILYYNLKQHIAAIKSMETMLQDYPESKKAEEIRFLIIKSSYDLAENSVYEKKLERFEKVIINHETFKRKYPKSRYNREAKDLRDASENQIQKLKA